MRTCVCNPAALKADEELHARSKGYSTSVQLFPFLEFLSIYVYPFLLSFPTFPLSLDSAMGKRKQRERQEEVDGERLRAESADDQDQKFLRRFEELMGPVRFRRLADEAYNAHGKGDGESGAMASHGVMENWTMARACSHTPRSTELLKRSCAGQLTRHLVRTRARALSLSLSLTHTHTNSYTYIYPQHEYAV